MRSTNTVLAHLSFLKTVSLMRLMNSVQDVVRLTLIVVLRILITKSSSDNHYVIEAKTPESGRTLMIGFEGTNDMVRDEREKQKRHNF